MLLAALRRFLTLIALASAGVVAVGAVLALLLGSSLSRAISLGFYGLGSFLLIAGFFVGNRGPSRVKSEQGRPFLFFFGQRRLRWATAEEQEQTLSESAVFVAVGFILILIGVAVDSRYQLF
jgi:hypothetical protein